MATATERWSDRKLTKGANNAWTAVRSFEVITATDEDDVFGATLTSTDLPNPTGLVPAHNEAHPLQSRLKVANRDVMRIGFNLYRLTVNYSIPADGTEHAGTEDPLGQPPRYRWRRTTVTEEVDRDIYGNPIVNSARDPFNRPAQRDFTNRILEIRRYEPYYDLSKAELYERKVNLGTFTITGVVSVGEGLCRCNLVSPTDEYVADAEYVEIVYELEFDPEGFRSRHLDEGSRAHIGDGTKAELYDKTGARISSPVLLAGNGTTLDTSLLAGTPPGITQVAYTDPPEGAEIETTADAAFLLYEQHEKISFGALL